MEIWDSGHVRARRGEAGRRADLRAPRRAARRPLDARPGLARRGSEELAAPAQARAARRPASGPRTGRCSRPLRPRFRRARAGRSRSSGTDFVRCGSVANGEGTAARAAPATISPSASPSSPGRCPGRCASPDCVVDGEVVALDEEGRPSFARDAAGSRKPPVLYAFDVLELDGVPVGDLPWTRAPRAPGRRSSTADVVRGRDSPRPSTTARRCSRPRRSRASRGSSPSARLPATSRASGRETG